MRGFQGEGHTDTAPNKLNSALAQFRFAQSPHSPRAHSVARGPHTLCRYTMRYAYTDPTLSSAVTTGAGGPYTR